MKNKKAKKRRSLLTFILISILIIFSCLFVDSIFYKNKVKIKDEVSKKNEYINVPEGFYYVGGTIDTGIVISDNKEDEKKGTDYDTTLNLKGNQFVWIPVENPVAKDENELNQLISKNIYPMAIKDGENYKGILYTLSNTGDAFSKYTGTSDNKDNLDECNREPGILSMNFYGDSNKLIENSTGDLYQNSFNEMIKSVQKNKGFFVSRYELGNLHQGNFVSKANQNDITSLSWVDGYNGIKNMYSSKKVNSEMIWGCQWDAIMIWLYFSDVRNEYFTLNTDALCNRTGSLLNTASSENYSRKNIFDLLGNASEFTQEAAYDSLRIARGGSFSYKTNTDTNNMLIREKFGIIYPYENVGFRATLLF